MNWKHVFFSIYTLLFLSCVSSPNRECSQYKNGEFIFKTDLNGELQESRFRRFGALEIDGSRVLSYNEKPRGDGNMVNGGFFVLSPSAIDYVDSDKTTWEKEPLERLASEGELMLWKHHGFWQPMDTLADKNHLENLWLSNKAPWKVW